MSAVLIVMIHVEVDPHWLDGCLSTGGQSSYHTLGGINTVIVRSCDISFTGSLLEESTLQFHGVNGTLNKLLFKN